MRPKILDRYMVSELVGPFLFGLSAFALIFAATNILAISRLVAEEHAPLSAAVEYFFWQLPSIVIFVVPMAMLTGTLLSLGRLSGESEIVALRAGGIGLWRCVTPLLVVGFVVSVLAFALQEGLVPFANDEAVALRQATLQHLGPFGGAGSHTVITQLPDGGKQVTYFARYDALTQELISVTIIAYGADGNPRGIIFSARGRYAAPSWTFDRATVYQFAKDQSLQSVQVMPFEQVDIGQKPSELQQLASDNNRETMSRSQIRQIIASGQLAPDQVRAYQTSYEEKLARPFASFVFTMIAIPFGLRPPRGGGGVGLGFGLAVAVGFAYFVMTSVFSALATNLPGGYAVSAAGAWVPNIIFIAIGAWLVRRAAAR